MKTLNRYYTNPDQMTDHYETEEMCKSYKINMIKKLKIALATNLTK